MKDEEKDFASFPLTGNKEQDEALSEEAKKHILRINDGVCPLGCARLVKVEGNYFECPICKSGVLKNPA